MDELAALVAARIALTRMSGTDALMDWKGGGGHELTLAGVDERAGLVDGKVCCQASLLGHDGLRVARTSCALLGGVIRL